MTDLRCLVVDDEPLAIDIVVTYLHQLDIQTISTANNAVEAFQQLQHQQVDLLFLDIQMPQLTGFDLLKSLPRRPLVVVTTAYRDYAVEGFEWEVLDYLVKPFSFARFLQTMEKASRAREAPSASEEKNILFLKTDRHLIRMEVDNILYIESLKDYIRVFTTDGNYLCHQSLTDITDRLPNDKFLRVHRSYTIALGKIDQVRQHCALIGAASIPISRAHRAELYRRLEK
jgi:DNA-binding LytR/AlgR family response regulator